MTVTKTKCAFACNPSFFYMNHSLDVLHRRAKLRGVTDNVLSCDTAGGDDLIFVIDVMGTGMSVQYTHADFDVTGELVLHKAHSGSLRDHYGYTRRVTFDAPIKGQLESLIVGIINDKNGLPLHTFEAKTQNGQWMIIVDSYKYFS